MNERVKKIILIVLFILSVIGIGTALFFAFFRSEPVTPPTVEPDITDETVSTLPDIPADRAIFLQTEAEGLREADDIAQGDLTEVTQLTSGAVQNTTTSIDGGGINYYSQADGRFYRIDEDGEVEALSDKKFPDVEDVTWNRNSQKAVIEFPDGSNIVYDFETEQQTTLPNHWEDFDFSPVGDEIIAKSIGIDPNNRWLVTVNDDGSNVRAFQALGNNESKVQVNWSPNDQIVAFADTATEALGSDIDRKIIFPVGKHEENYKGLITEGINFSSQWVPNGKRLMYSVSGAFSEYKPLLWLVDATPATMGNNRQSLGLNTWVEKCTFSDSNTAFCAVPQTLPPNAGLQPSLFDSYPDSLYKLDLSSGTVSLIAVPETNTTMTDLFVTEDDSRLFYKNVATDELEMIKLK